MSFLFGFLKQVHKFLVIFLPGQQAGTGRNRKTEISERHSEPHYQRKDAHIVGISLDSRARNAIQQIEFTF